jgi:hypothetical protein
LGTGRHYGIFYVSEKFSTGIFVWRSFYSQLVVGGALDFLFLLFLLFLFCLLLPLNFKLNPFILFIYYTKKKKKKKKEKIRITPTPRDALSLGMQGSPDSPIDLAHTYLHISWNWFSFTTISAIHYS